MAGPGLPMPSFSKVMPSLRWVSCPARVFFPLAGFFLCKSGPGTGESTEEEGGTSHAARYVALSHTFRGRARTDALGAAVRLSAHVLILLSARPFPRDLGTDSRIRILADDFTAADNFPTRTVCRIGAVDLTLRRLLCAPAIHCLSEGRRCEKGDQGARS